MSTLAWLFVLVNAAPTKDQTKTLSVIFVSNRQGEVAPCHCDADPIGGVDRQVASVRRQRDEIKNLIVLDGGDDFFASPEQSQAGDATARAELIADALAEIKANALVPGERDYLRGAPALRELGARARATWVVSNVSIATGRPPMFTPYLVVEAGGQKVLVLGLWDALPPAIKNEGYKLDDPVRAAERWVATYRNAVDMIVAIAHTSAQVEEQLAEKVDGLSLIFGAHEGRLQFAARAAGKAQILAAGKEGKYLVRADLRYAGTLPRFEAGNEVQKYFRDRAELVRKRGAAADDKARREAERALAAHDAKPLARKSTLFFNLIKLGADVEGDAALTARAKAIDPAGYLR